MNNFPPNMNPEAFTITALIVGLIIEDDFTSDELNAIGNWFELVGQLLLTTGAQQQLINDRYQNNLGSKIKSDANNHSAKNPVLASQSEVENLSRRLDRLESMIRNQQ